MSDPPPQPQLTDGVVVLRPWSDDDVAAAVAGHDAEIAHWFGFPEPQPTREQQQKAVDDWRRDYADGRRRVSFVVERDGDVVGTVEVRDIAHSVGELSWVLYAGQRGRGSATRAVRLLVDYALGDLGMTRVQARVEPENTRSVRVATRSGLRREGVMRVAAGTGERPETHEYVVLARLRDDPPITEPQAFRALLNSFLPRKRAIAQMLVRDHAGRVLLCQLTYKEDWDLPGGVVEVHESPRLAVVREVEEELGLDIPAGRLLVTDWLPSWSGWDDALCLVFDGGVHEASLAAHVVLQPREIRSAEFCSLEQARARCADFTARRITAALANVDGSGPCYTESGRRV
jgi:RimJ/RimL family protein N-acetyltransferase/8-oxo-dGTP pyrophosphatase MutT (NUDIX family)